MEWTNYVRISIYIPHHIFQTAPVTTAAPSSRSKERPPRCRVEYGVPEIYGKLWVYPPLGVRC